MTHDELLAKINDRHWKLFNFHWEDQSDEAVNFRKAVQKTTQALRTVVELHKPWDGVRLSPGAGSNGPWCTHCEEVFDGSIKYPCPTIRTIERELG